MDGVGMKTETIIPGYRESFSRFYRLFGQNENDNGYRKNENENDKKIRKRKRKRFQPLPTVFTKYRILPVIYRR